ncbi:MAG: glycoside hydrolase domain-containing protein, partial [Victivallaceae bacterium]
WSIIDWPEMVSENPGFNWPTGDTHLLYPGRNGPLESLRWHVYKQGQQDLRVFMSLPPGIERDALLTELGACRPVKWRECPGMQQQRLYHLIENYQHAGQL